MDYISEFLTENSDYFHDETIETAHKLHNLLLSDYEEDNDVLPTIEVISDISNNENYILMKYNESLMLICNREEITFIRPISNKFFKQRMTISKHSFDDFSVLYHLNWI